MTKEQIIQSMTKYYSTFAASGLQMNELEAFAQWFLAQNFNIADEIHPNMFQHPKSKQLFELASQTGVLKRANVIKCPACGERTGSYMDIDRDLMPEYSRCNKGHLFRTMDTTATSSAYFIKGITANIYY